MPDPSSLSTLIRSLPAERPDTRHRLAALHEVLRARHPAIDRIAIALYDPATDLLKTFASANVDAEPLSHYEARLADVPSLAALAAARQSRVVHDMHEALAPGSPHTDWLLAQRFRSSYTLPVFQGDALGAFLFFDARQPGVFTPEVTAFLDSFGELAAQLYLVKLGAARSLVGAVHIASRIASIRDVETGMHLERMAKYSRLIARRLALAGAPIEDEFIEYVHLFAPLHDIGKVGVPDRVLLKPGRLDADEWALMQRHVAIGEGMVEHILHDLGLEGDPAGAVMRHIVAGHHERGDGSGYPRGLRLEQIALEARIVAVADVFDALSTERPYKPAWPDAEVHAELRREAAAGRLDAACVEVLLEAVDEVAAIREAFGDHRERTPG